MSKRDPWTAPGAIYIPSDCAPAPPVPAGTRLGNVQEMAEEMEPFHQALVELTKDPVKLRDAVSTLTAQWTPDQLDNEIVDDLRKGARVATHTKSTNRRGGSRPGASAARAQTRRRNRARTSETSRFHAIVTSWIDQLQHYLHVGIDRKSVPNPS